MAYREQKKPAEAQREFDRGIQVAAELVDNRLLEPGTLALLYRERARIRLESKERDAALADVEKAIELETGPDSTLALARTHALRGRILQSLDRHQEAIGAFR